MKPFNAEAALRGEPVCTKSGEIVTELHQFKNGSFTGFIGTETTPSKVKE